MEPLDDEFGPIDMPARSSSFSVLEHLPLFSDLQIHYRLSKQSRVGTRAGNCDKAESWDWDEGWEQKEQGLGTRGG